MTYSSAYDDYFNDSYLYPPHSFIVLRTLNFVCCIFSLVGCIATITVYAVLRWYYKYKASRVSIRCVFFSTIMNMINAVCDIIFIQISSKSSACFPLAIINNYCAIASAAFLTLIGVNLLVVFVFQLKHKNYHEYMYYIFALIYSLVSLALPIYYLHFSCASGDDHHSCWFAIYYASSYCGEAVWTWLYSFLMLLILFSAICSVIALIKLRRESKIIAGDTYQRQKKSVKKRTSMVTKVVIRCVIYLMVPLICYICGFAVQTIVLQSLYPPFGLAFASVFLRSLMGVFVAIIFFGDPFVTTVVKSKARRFIQKYVHEYYEIDISDNSSDDHDGDHDGIHHRSYFHSILYYMRRIPAMIPSAQRDEASSCTCVKKQRQAVRCVSAQYPMQSTASAMLSPSARSPEMLLLHEPVRSHTIDRSPSIPLARPNSIQSTRSTPRKFQSVSSACYDRRPIIGIDPFDANRVYMPYTHPRLAIVTHWILVRVFRIRQAENEGRSAYQNMPEKEQGSTDKSVGFDDDTYTEAASQQPPMPRRPEMAIYIPREPTVSHETRERRQLQARQEQDRTSSLFWEESLNSIGMTVPCGRNDTSTLMRDTSSPESVKEL